MIRFRPVGMVKLRLVCGADLRGFPPRLPEQPISNFGHAERTARDRDTKSHSFTGYVTRFEDGYASRTDGRIVGECEHEELWAPTGEPEEFNRRIAGLSGMVAGYFGARFSGRVPRMGSFGGKGAVDHLVLLAEFLREDYARFEEAVVDDRTSVFLHHPSWGQDEPH